jgi:predicted transposase YdaD
MVTDPIFYRLFATSPETFFMLLGMANDQARETAMHYEYEAIEFKETAHRSDGVFRPREIGLPLYFLEVQFYNRPSIYAAQARPAGPCQERNSGFGPAGRSDRID